MRPLYVILAALLAPVGVYFLLPGEDERLAMLIRDGRHREAAAALQRRLDAGETDPALRADLARTREAAGDVRGAVALMREVVALRPNDPAGFYDLAQLCLRAQSPDAAIAAMSRAVALAPDGPAVARLAGWLRLYNRFDEEAALLRDMRARGVRLAPPELLRLGTRLAAAGDYDAALPPLREAAASDRERGGTLLFDALVAAGRADEAVDRALVWLDAAGDGAPSVAVRLLQRLPQRTPDRARVRLAEAALRRNPDGADFLAKTLVEQGRPALAAQILSQWTASARRPTATQIGGVIAVARTTGDETLLWRMAPAVLRKSRAAPAQAYYIDALAHLSGDAAIVAAQAARPAPIFQARPLLAARLALGAGDPPRAMRALTNLRLADLSPGDRRAWVELVAAASSRQVALTILLDRRRAGALPRDLLPRLAELAGQLGYSGEQTIMMNEWARR